jgi:hypothetical protein
MPIKPAFAAYRSIVFMAGAPALARAQRLRQDILRRQAAEPAAETKAGCALFLLAVLVHAGAERVELVSTPGRLRHLSGLGTALPQRLLARATHVILATLRQARRCDRGNREAKCDCSDMSVDGEHC